MNRLDGQGHHPGIRPYFPHFKGFLTKKVGKNRCVLPLSKQLAVLWTKLGAYTTEKEERILNTLIDLGVLETNETGKEPMCGCEIACGGLSDCSITYADPSRPPPKQGWIHNIRYYVTATLFGMLMLVATACKKDPNGTNNTNEPVVPTKEVIIHWDWDADIGWAPPKDSIKYYTDQSDVETLNINLIGLSGIGLPVNCTGFRASTFHKARDTLQTRIDIDPSKVRLSGTILINFQNGATITSLDNNYDPGMMPPDSAWFTRNGCIVRRPPHGK